MYITVERIEACIERIKACIEYIVQIRELRSLICTMYINQVAGIRAYARAPGLQIALSTLPKEKTESNRTN
jgi:hypothetical protein